MSLVCQNVTLEVSGRTLCRDVELNVQPGEVWGVLGPNGSGKTTLLNTMSGLTMPARGSVTLDQQPLTALSPKARARAIGVLPQQEEHEFWGSVLEYVLLGRFPHAPAWLGWQADDEALARAVLQQLGLAEFGQRRYATLSGGERQRVRVAQLLAQAPQYLLLDEPLQHLDLRYQIQLLDLAVVWARDQRRGVVMVLHDVLWPARVCSHALLLDGAGGARAGTSRELLTQANLEALFGCPLHAAGDSARAGFVPAI